jgi:aspartyl-tRNA(Asn)/glutamyl-tRNA(Gln) amidotransferase subunit A
VTELWQLTIAEAAARLEKREIGALELTAALLDRVETTDSAINAYITVTVEQAREAAKASQQRHDRGASRGPLDGIPVAYKDLFDTRGVATTAGAGIFRNRVPDRDATAVARLADAGAVMLGKLNTHEFALGATTINPHFGPTRNPWDRARIPGGSSGGSGAAVAAGSALGALGTDTGGSVRIPAALCGISGLKPTYGRVSRAGVYPLSYSLDHAGPMARTVEDCALLLQAIAGPDPRDAGSSAEPVPDYRAALRTNLAGRKIGLPAELWETELEPAVERTVRHAIADLGTLGAEIREVRLGEAARARNVLGAITGSEVACVHDELTPEQIAGLGADIRKRVLAGRLYTGMQYVRAQRVRALARHELATAMVGLDALALPTVSMVAAPIADPGPSDRLSTLCSLFNLTGSPALSVLCGFSEDGLPVGLQLVGHPFEESTVLAIGHAYQQATDWHRRRPAL